MICNRFKTKAFICGVLLVLSNVQTKAQTYRYSNVKLGGGGFVSGIITCPTVKNLIYARTDVGGAYRWNDTTGAWIPLVDWINEGQVGYSGVEALAIDPNAPSKLYMLAGINYFNGGQTAILRSNDYGATFSITNVTTQFKAHGNGGGRQNGERLAVDPNKGTILFCGTRSNGLFKSIDAGVNWTNVATFPATTTNNGNGVCLVIFDKTTGTSGNATQTIYAGVSRMGTDNFYVSKDGGVTWNAVAGQNNAFMPQRAVIASDGNMFITYGDGCGPGGGGAEPMGNGAIMKYNTKTGAWTNVSPVIAGNTLAFGGISVDATNPKRLIATTINKYLAQPQYPGSTNTPWGDRIFVSADGGATWTDLIGAKKFQFNTGGSQWVSGSAIHWAGSIEFDPYNPDRAFVASGNGIYMSANLSAAVTTWTFTTNGLEETVPRDAVSIPGGPFAWVMYDYDGCVQSDVNVSTKTHQPGMGTTTGIDYAGKNSSYIVRVGGWDQTKPTAYYTTNSGTTWTACAGKPTGTSLQGKVGVNADGTVIVWVPDGQANAYYSTNNGTNWSQCNGFNIQNGRVVGDRVNPQKFYAYGNGVIYVSTDAGKNFAAAGNAGAGGSNIIRPVPDIEGDIWVALQGGGLTRSTNSGTTFNKITTVTSCRSVGFGKAATGKTFPTVYIWGKVGGITGIFRSDDIGVTWTRVNDDYHQWGGPGNGEFVIGDMNIYGRYYMSSAGRGVVYGEIDNTPKNIKVTLSTSTTTICANQTAILTALPTLTTGTLTKLEFYEGTTLLSTINKAPYTYTITATTNGIHNYTVKATSSLNETATSQSVSIQVGSSAVITPYLQINSGAWAQTNTATVCSGGMVVAGPQPSTVTGWSWKGPNNYSATTREITLGGVNTAQSGIFTASYDDGSGCPVTMDISITVNVTPAPIVTPLTYNVGATATALTANGIALKWYNTATGGTALVAAPIPNTSTVGTTSYYVSQTVAPCGEGNRAKIDVTVVNPFITQTIQLNVGWNLISINVMPTDSSIATLFKGLDVQEIKVMDAFWEKGQFSIFNTLTSITSGTGYLVNMNIAGVLSVTGVQTNAIVQNLKTGWQLVGCPYQLATPLTSVYNSANAQFIKNFDGFWSPSGSTNSITTINPGKGYFLKK